MINELISELVTYGMIKGLVADDDRVYVTNKLLELFRVEEYVEKAVEPRDICFILEELVEYALEKGILEDNTIAMRDLFDTKVMGLLTPSPAVVRKAFYENYNQSPQKATDFFYKFSVATNYIRKDRIEMDEKWVTDTDYGPIDITINLSKPEKDTRDIAKAGSMKKTGYPCCLLCKENEGYAGHISHPARQNHRVIPIKLAGEQYFMQYSPYVYYNEHCIVFHDKHIPMKIDKSVFMKLLDFVKQFPHYTVGSNADLPIVGGSILSHDHFQGGSYVFPMARAPYKCQFTIKGYESVRAGIVNWPMSVIRLQGKDADRVAQAADEILTMWRSYTDKDALIFHETNGVLHNTITPIARKRDALFEMDLVLRNNITTKDCPWGVYHPAEKYHHIKKENIGLIEVMGLAVLPARLKREMRILADAILNGEDVRANRRIAKHADWVEEWRATQKITPDNVEAVIREEIGKVFVKVLECSGVYKCTDEGMDSFKRFISQFAEVPT